MAKICEICCEFIVLQDKRNTRYMDNGNENNISGREKFDMKAWSPRPLISPATPLTGGIRKKKERQCCGISSRRKSPAI